MFYRVYKKVAQLENRLQITTFVVFDTDFTTYVFTSADRSSLCGCQRRNEHLPFIEYQTRQNILPNPRFCIFYTIGTDFKVCFIQEGLARCYEMVCESI